jgi:hypothetical protein
MRLAETGCNRPSPRRGLRPESTRRRTMAKYLIAWLLGVPAVVLVILYFFFH